MSTVLFSLAIVSTSGFLTTVTGCLLTHFYGLVAVLVGAGFLTIAAGFAWLGYIKTKEDGR